MAITEKNSLVNEITMKFAEDYNLPVKEIKTKLLEIVQQYHITISDERFCGNDLSTDYLFKKFSEAKKAVGMTEKTLSQYKIAILKLEEITQKKMAEIEAEDINYFLRTYGKIVKDVTLRGKFQLLSSVYNFLFQHRYIPHNPILMAEAPKASVIYQEPLSTLNIEKVKAAIESLPKNESLRDMALVSFFISTGCRVSEACNVKLSDIDLEQKVCKVMGKGRKERPVVLTDNACYRIKLYLESRENKQPDAPLFAHIRGPENQMTKDGVNRMLEKLKDKAGVDRLTCHMFRRYYATELRKRGVSIQMIASSLGHANLNQINRYSLYNNSEMLNVVRNAM